MPGGASPGLYDSRPAVCSVGYLERRVKRLEDQLSKLVYAASSVVSHYWGDSEDQLPKDVQDLFNALSALGAARKGE